MLVIEQQSDGCDHTNLGFGQQITINHTGWLGKDQAPMEGSFSSVVLKPPHYGLFKMIHCVKTKREGWVLLVKAFTLLLTINKDNDTVLGR